MNFSDLVDPLHVHIYMALIPLFSTVISTLALSRTFTAKQWIGLVLQVSILRVLKIRIDVKVIDYYDVGLRYL